MIEQAPAADVQRDNQKGKHGYFPTVIQLNWPDGTGRVVSTMTAKAQLNLVDGHRDYGAVRGQIEGLAESSLGL
ncbi:Elongation factor [Trichinella pseudospiralis]